MAGTLDRLASISQRLEPFLLALGKLQAGDSDALSELKDFVEEHASDILRARSLESEGCFSVRQFAPSVSENSMKQAINLLLKMAEQAEK